MKLHLYSPNVLHDFFLHRGELKIAEVSSRFTDLNKFISVIADIGFKLKSKVRVIFEMKGNFDCHCLLM